MRWARNVALTFTLFARKPEESRPIGRPRRRWEDSIRMDLREIGRGGMDWVCLVQGKYQWRAYVDTGMNLRVLKNVGNFMSS
jgi:hypothetical protein